MRASFGAAFLVMGLICGVAAQERGIANPAVIVRELVTGMARGERQEVRVITAHFKPGERTVFHTHRFPVTVFVIEGVFTLELEGYAPVTVNAGQAFVEPPNVKMTGYNRGTQPLKVVVFYVGDPGTPFLDPAH